MLLTSSILYSSNVHPGTSHCLRPPLVVICRPRTVTLLPHSYTLWAVFLGVASSLSLRLTPLTFWPLLPETHTLPLSVQILSTDLYWLSMELLRSTIVCRDCNHVQDIVLFRSNLRKTFVLHEEAK